MICHQHLGSQGAICSDTVRSKRVTTPFLNRALGLESDASFHSIDNPLSLANMSSQFEESPSSSLFRWEGDILDFAPPSHPPLSNPLIRFSADGELSGTLPLPQSAHLLPAALGLGDWGPPPPWLPAFDQGSWDPPSPQRPPSQLADVLPQQPSVYSPPAFAQVDWDPPSPRQPPSVCWPPAFDQVDWDPPSPQRPPSPLTDTPRQPPSVRWPPAFDQGSWDSPSPQRLPSPLVDTLPPPPLVRWPPALGRGTWDSPSRQQPPSSATLLRPPSVPWPTAFSHDDWHPPSPLSSIAIFGISRQTSDRGLLSDRDHLLDGGSSGIQPRSSSVSDRSETSRSQYPCTAQEYPKSPAWRRDPNRHPNAHILAPQPRYYCRVCRGLFEWQHRHTMGVRIPEKRYPCEHCPRRYTRRDNLKA